MEIITRVLIKKSNDQKAGINEKTKKIILTKTVTKIEKNG